MSHFHYCEQCGDDTIFCDLPHCELQDVERDYVIEKHWREVHEGKP